MGVRRSVMLVSFLGKEKAVGGEEREERRAEEREERERES